MPKPADWLLWQLADAAFPSGGLAHSAGLEAAVRWGAVRDGDALERFLVDQLTQTAEASAPLMHAVLREPARFDEFDRLCQAMLSNHVANRASRAQGRSLAMAAAAAFARPALVELSERMRRKPLPMHLAPTFGAVMASLEVPCEAALRLFLYITARSLLSSAVRLNVVGPLQAQAIQAHLGDLCERLAERAREISLAEVAQTAPLIELLQASQDRLYSRLFQS